MFCTKCYKEIDNGSVFCRYCGNKIIEEKLKPTEKQEMKEGDGKNWVYKKVRVSVFLEKQFNKFLEQAKNKMTGKGWEFVRLDVTNNKSGYAVFRIDKKNKKQKMLKLLLIWFISWFGFVILLVIGGLIGMQKMGNILLFVGLLGISLGLLGLVKGSIKFLKIKNRKSSALLTTCGFVLMMMGGIISSGGIPSSEMSLTQPVESPTSPIQPVTSQFTPKKAIKKVKNYKLDKWGYMDIYTYLGGKAIELGVPEFKAHNWKAGYIVGVYEGAGIGSIFYVDDKSDKVYVVNGRGRSWFPELEIAENVDPSTASKILFPDM